MQEFITTLFNGLSLSSIILLTSLGLAITFGLMRVINMAHGEFVMIGAYMTYVTQQLFSAFLPISMRDWYYIAALPLAFAATFLLGAVLEKLVISRLYGREIDSLLATWGISLILQQAARSIFGAQGVNVNAPKFLSGGLTVVCLGGVGLLMYRTAFGRQVRAVMQNRPMAQCMGINSRRVDSLTFSLGSGLAGLAGCSLALLGSIDATVGQNYIVNSFMAVVLGGVGRLLGTVVGSTAIGGASIFAENYTSATIAKAIVLLLVIVFLQKRPQGLFTIRSRSLDD